ncbi:MAG: hypothetical protein JW763_09935 [candidate division Zixibacteria bacterium]|nr:hypothetical protein [candidate division Zixibacteria bacterium]
MKYNVVTAKEDRDLLSRADKRICAEWPEFMLHDPVADLLDLCYDELPDYQFVITANDHNEPLAIANSIPLLWHDPPECLPEEGWDWALTRGFEDFRGGRACNILCALQIVVFSENRGKALSGVAVDAMKAIGRTHDLEALIAPVRPSRKCDHPLISIDEYVTWTVDNGFPYDPWMRVHVRLGARIIKPCHKAMRITGTVAEWRNWTGMDFPETDSYIIPGALEPVEIDLDRDLGTYVEPNVWMCHPLQMR